MNQEDSFLSLCQPVVVRLIDDVAFNFNLCYLRWLNCKKSLLNFTSENIMDGIYSGNQVYPIV